MVLESVPGGVVVNGTVSARWEGECRRCLEPATGRLLARVRELCSDDADPELGYPMTADWLDLESASPRCLYLGAAARAAL